MMRDVISNMDIKKANRNRIYRLISQKGGVSRSEIAKRLGMSMPTVMQNVTRLLELGYVRESGIFESTGGRKAVALSCVSDARMAIGVAVAKHRVNAVLVNMAGEVLDRSSESIAFTATPAYSQQLEKLVADLIDRRGVRPDAILGVGVSIPGILSEDSRTFDSHVLGIDGCACGDLTRNIAYPSIYCNDANAAGIAELWTSGFTAGSFVYVSLNDSVGGAVVLGNRLYVGDTQRGGEFGHLVLERDGRKCYCGKKGCWDAYCSATVLSRLTDGDLDGFFHRLDVGNEMAKSAWDVYLEYLAQGVNILRMAFDCDVIIGGYVGAHIERYIGDLRRRAARNNTFGSRGEYIKPCRHCIEPSAVGASLLHIEKFINSI